MQDTDNDSYSCIICDVAGHIDMDNCISEESKLLLAEDDNGLLMCLICYMKQMNECLHCGERVDCILPSSKCFNTPWLCEECLNLPYTVHVAACYKDGCMTIEEFAEECFRDLAMDDIIDLA